MLSKKDREFLKEEIQKAVKEALTVDFCIQEVKYDEKKKEHIVVGSKVEKKYIPSYFCELLSHSEGALRGIQEQVCIESNNVNKLIDKVEIVGNILLNAENSFKTIAHLSDYIKLNYNTFKEIDYVEGEINDRS